MNKKPLRHFYIAEEQSIYLLSQTDANKLKRWVNLCIEQLEILGYSNVYLIGKGAYGFVFNGIDVHDKHHVFKFSRINLPLHIQNRLEEEAEVQSELNHPCIPQVIEYSRIKSQSILHMERAPGIDLERMSLQCGPLAPEQVVSIAIQLAEILLYLRNRKANHRDKIYVHGDIKPSNVMFDSQTGKVYLVDWGSSVYAQIDADGHATTNNMMDLMSDSFLQTNSRLGDVYFIGEEQLAGGLSSPRFDEQGFAATIYALASGQSCRFGSKIITPSSLGLPKLLAKTLESMLSDDPVVRYKAGDYFFKNLHVLKMQVLSDHPSPAKINPLIPVWVKPKNNIEIDTVVYGSRKSFLRSSSEKDELMEVDDTQLDKYYKNYLMGMGDIEKAFIAALGRCGRFPIVGGLAIRWTEDGVYIDSNLTLFDESLATPFKSAVNNMIYLAQGIRRIGVFKSCLFNARDTIHVERDDDSLPFITRPEQRIEYRVSDVPDLEDETKMHSYFEDGRDPDEYLQLPKRIEQTLQRLNTIHHTGCLIFEILPNHLKIHSYLMLLNHDKEQEFRDCLQQIMDLLPEIRGLGISGVMKLPYKDTRFFKHIDKLPDKFYPRDPRTIEA